MQGSALVLANNYFLKCRYMHAGYCSAVSVRFVAMASFANVLQPAIL